MCPIWPLHLIIIYLLALCPLWVVCQTIPNLTATFNPDELTVLMDTEELVGVTIQGPLQLNDDLRIVTRSSVTATGEWNSTYQVTQENVDSQRWQGTMKVFGNFLEITYLSVVVGRGNQEIEVQGSLPVTVLRPERLIDTIFTTSVALFVSLIFINFGCAMHWPTVKEVVKRPVGPAIGILGQFVLLPLISFGLGFLIFPDSPSLRLGMFFTGVSPGGGASNIWTFILGGNLNLSLAMTTISTLACFGFMPAWLFSLGQVVFDQANIVVPYQRIATFIIGLIIPLIIGLAMQKFTPRIAQFMVRILKGFSTTLLLFIIIFAIATNVYIFSLFSWQIVLAGMGIPWIGYSVGYAVARLFKQPHEDALAISIETGIQNTGISIFLLRYALPQPAADLATVVPVSVAIMTPIPMTAIYIYQKIMGCYRRRSGDKKELTEGDTPSVSEKPDGESPPISDKPEGESNGVSTIDVRP